MRNCYAEPGQPISDIECSIEKKYFPNTDPSFHDFAVREIINNIKESTFKISEFPNQETARVQYKLPDETLLELGNERFRIPEVFFIGNEEFPGFSGVHNMAVDSINKCSLGIKRELFNNIILTGGNSTFEGFSEKFMKRVHDLTPNGLKARVLSVNSRKYSTWIGGSILGVISGFRPMMISKQDYEETGVGMIDKKCP
jgi:actin-related protein